LTEFYAICYFKLDKQNVKAYCKSIVGGQMVTSSGFITAFATIIGCPRHEFDRIAANLRKARLIPVGGRGIYAAELDAHTAANLFIALIASNRPKDAVKAVGEFSALKAVKEDNSPPFSYDGNTLGVALDEIFSDVELAYKIEKIKVFRSWPAANMSMKIGGQSFTISFKPEGQPKENRFMVSTVTIDGALIHQLAIKVNGSPDL
jgi:hypothetical protein